MGYINFRDPNGTRKEREARTKLAEERQAIKPAKEFKQIQEIQEQEKLKELERFEYFDAPTGVSFDKDPEVFYTEEQLKEHQEEVKAMADDEFGLTDEELKAKARRNNIIYMFE